MQNECTGVKQKEIECTVYQVEHYFASGLKLQTSAHSYRGRCSKIP